MNLYISRFGKYPIFHSTNFLMIIYFVLFLIFGGLKNPLTYIALMFSIICELSLVHPFWEKYYIENNVIHKKKLNYQYNIPIPDDAIIVFSYTTTSVRYNDRYMVNLISSNPDDVLQILHSNSIYNQWEAVYRHKKPIKEIYDNRFVEGHLKEKNIYSFVYDFQVFQESFQNPKRTVIIPRSIYDKIEFNENLFNIIIDEKG